MVSPKKIWIDLDNSPHIPFFSPIIRELNDMGYVLTITARDCFQVCGLADLYGLSYKRVGVHYGKNKVMKAVGLMIRSAQLLPTALRIHPDLTISHGSRSQLLLSAILKIPSVLLMDYEFAQKVAAPDWLIMPDAITAPTFHFDKKRIIHYPGIKEDVYVPEFKPDPGLREELGFHDGFIHVTIRPPATEAHYHNPESEQLFSEVIRFLGEKDKITMIILPRNERQSAAIKSDWPQYVQNNRICIPEKVVNGLNLIWHSDLVISGGGTINREAAALGVPVYSIFRGRLGAIDRYLSETGRLHLIHDSQDIQDKIVLRPRALALKAIDSPEQAPENLQSLMKTGNPAALAFLATSREECERSRIQGQSAALHKIIESISAIAEGACHGKRETGELCARGIHRSSHQVVGRGPFKNV